MDSVYALKAPKYLLIDLNRVLEISKQDDDIFIQIPNVKVKLTREDYSNLITAQKDHELNCLKS